MKYYSLCYNELPKFQDRLLERPDEFELIQHAAKFNLSLKIRLYISHLNHKRMRMFLVLQKAKILIKGGVLT